MGALIRYERHPLGRRCFVLGRRLHHWLAGAAMVAFGLALALAGGIAMWHDRRDAHVAWADWRDHA